MAAALSLLPSIAPLSSQRVRPHSFAAASPTASSSSRVAQPSISLNLPVPPVPSPPKKKVLVHVGLGTEEMEAVIVVDVLRRAGADVLVASVEEGLQIEGSPGTKLLADTFIAACANQSFDLVALPGGMPGSARLRDCQVLQEIVRRQADEKLLHGAICVAPAVVLKPWGLTRRKHADLFLMTCHPAFIHKIPSFRAVKSKVQVSGELTTSRGPGTAFEFALAFVQQVFGDVLAQEIKGKMLVQTDGVIQKEEVNKIEWSFNRVPRVLLPIANGSEEMEVIVACQNTKIVADLYIDAVREAIFDLIVLPDILTGRVIGCGREQKGLYKLALPPYAGGGVVGAERLQKSTVLKKLLKEQKTEGRAYGAICSSPIVLQKLGLLGSKKVTGHPTVVNKLKCPVTDQNGVVIDGKIITSKDLNTVMDFSLAIVSKLLGHARARSVAEGLIFEYQRRE